jgi:2-amino-4-hydroxy-6-hydroxymethyldihydropteridine diphosphokinase
LAIALGANWPGPAGTPFETLQAVRPELEALLQHWAQGLLITSWSPLLETQPVGGPASQPCYCNAVVRVSGELGAPSASSALSLLDGLQALERQFGRDRVLEVRWGPRCLDLDLLFWDELRLEHPRLLLPHPRLHLRGFVLEPLVAAMQGTVSWPASHAGPIVD